jgi:hypothetical protein
MFLVLILSISQNREYYDNLIIRTVYSICEHCPSHFKTQVPIIYSWGRDAPKRFLDSVPVAVTLVR